MTTSENNLGNIPRTAIFRGRKVQVVWYEPGEAKPFRIVLWDDSQRNVSRNQLIFPRPKKKD